MNCIWISNTSDFANPFYPNVYGSNSQNKKITWLKECSLFKINPIELSPEEINQGRVSVKIQTDDPKASNGITEKNVILKFDSKTAQKLVIRIREETEEGFSQNKK